MNTPAVRFTFPGRVSARKVSAMPRIGSGGAGTRASDGSDTVHLGGDGAVLRRYTARSADRRIPRRRAAHAGARADAPRTNDARNPERPSTGRLPRRAEGGARARWR